MLFRSIMTNLGKQLDERKQFARLVDEMMLAMGPQVAYAVVAAMAESMGVTPDEVTDMIIRASDVVSEANMRGTKITTNGVSAMAESRERFTQLPSTNDVMLAMLKTEGDCPLCGDGIGPKK